ncbi:MAG: glycosyltransferase [Planctomycetota bacterium]
MRVAFDLSPRAPGLPLGVARVFDGALAALAARGQVELIPIAPPARAAAGARRAAWRQLALPREAARLGADVLHCFVSAFPLRAALPVIATVHELPWRHGERENAGLVHRAWGALAQRRAAAVVCPSTSVARALGPRARAIPWGLAPAFCGAGGQGAPSGAGPIPQAGPAPRPYVLLVGGARAKKRLDHLLAAQRLARAPWDIVVTGSEAPAAHAAGATLRSVGRVDDRALAALYRGAAACAVLARSEGFAFPVLEALACGTAVVVPAGSVQAETAGGLAVEVPMDDVEALAARLDELAKAPSSPEERAARSAYAAHFTWDRAAAALEDLWRAALAAQRTSYPAAR